MSDDWQNGWEKRRERRWPYYCALGVVSVIWFVVGHLLGYYAATTEMMHEVAQIESTGAKVYITVRDDLLLYGALPSCPKKPERNSELRGI